MRTKRIFSFTLALTLVLSLMNFGNYAVAAKPVKFTPPDVAISEVAWMGTVYSYNDEWIELYNNTDGDIDLTGWVLRSTDGDPVVSLDGVIPANTHYLLERTDDTSVPGIDADMIYTGILGNTGETLELVDASGLVMDTVDTWHAGDNDLKASMERIDTLAIGTDAANWMTATTEYDGGFGTPTATVMPFAAEIVISEISWMGTTYSYNDEWMELYNRTSSSIDITGWTLASADGDPSIVLSGSIPANGHFLLERTDDTSVPGVAADQVYTGILGNTVELLELRKPDGTLVDNVDAWYAGNNDTKATMARADYSVEGTVAANWVTSTEVYDGGFGTPLNTSSGTVTPPAGAWTPGNLEIHHINVGQGDATLVVGPTGKSLLIDAGESYWNSTADADVIGPYIENILGHKNLDYVLITHFHLDHIGYVGYGGLWNLVEVQGFTVGQMLHRDYNTYLGTTSGTFDNWKIYIEGAGNAKLNPVIAVEGTSQIDLGTGVAVDIVAVDGNGEIIPGNFSLETTPPSENDYSIAMNISYGDFDEFIGGDISGEYSTSSFDYKYHDVETGLAIEVGDIDVYRVNHHGSDHSNNDTFLGQLDPEVSIISVGDDNTYGHPRQPVMDKLLATSTVYMTEHGDPLTDTGSAIIGGHIVLKTADGITYTVNGDSYTATEPVRTDADGDGYFAEVDPNDGDAGTVPLPYGGTDPIYQ